FMHTDPLAWYCSHRHDAAGANEYYQYSYLYGVAIDLPSGATTLTLPNNNHVFVLAATVGNDPANATTPAQALMDEVQTRTAMTPIAATGWNRDIIVEAAAVTPYTDDALAFDVPNGYAFYEHGLSGGSSRDGLPNGGAFVSGFDRTTQVQLQPYSAANALFMN